MYQRAPKLKRPCTHRKKNGSPTAFKAAGLLLVLLYGQAGFTKALHWYIAIMFNDDAIQLYPRDWHPLLTLTRLSVDVAMTGRTVSDFTPFTPSEMLAEMQRWEQG
jgi:hypothetical protein